MTKEQLIVGKKYKHITEIGYIVTIQEILEDGRVFLEEEPGGWAIWDEKYGGFLGSFEPLETE